MSDRGKIYDCILFLNEFYSKKVKQQYGKWPDVATIKPK